MFFMGEAALAHAIPRSCAVLTVGRSIGRGEPTITRFGTVRDKSQVQLN